MPGTRSYIHIGLQIHSNTLQQENLITYHLLMHPHFCRGKDQKGFPGGSDGKESTCNAGDLGLIPGLGRSPGGGQGSPLQYSCLENPMDRGAWRATVHGVTESDTTV